MHVRMEDSSTIYGNTKKKNICISLVYKCTSLLSVLTCHSFCIACCVFKVPILVVVYNYWRDLELPLTLKAKDGGICLLCF